MTQKLKHPAPKPLWRSKTVWFNVAMAGAVALEASLSVLQATTRPEIYLGLVVITAAGNAFLRIISSGKVTIRSE